MRRSILPIVLATLLLVVSGAHAAPVTIKKSMWGPVFVDGESQFPIYEDLGVGLWQYTLNWASVAPTRPLAARNPDDPAYQWPPEADAALAEAEKHGIKVSLMLIGAPPWANGNRTFRWAPDKPSDFAAFTRAAARRFPAVRHWMIWSEPTKASNFQPLDADEGKPLKGKKLRGPRKYSQILDASYVALKDESAKNLVIGGNTFTVGTVAPLRWVKALKLPGGRRPRMDLWGHNPFSARVPRLKADPLGNGYADFSDLDELARALDEAFKRARPRKMRRLRLFLSEFSLPTDHGNHEFNYYVSRKSQAEWLTKALRITRTYKRIYTLGYLGLYDDAKRPGNDQVERGLLTRSGEKKPGYAAFKKG